MSVRPWTEAYLQEAPFSIQIELTLGCNLQCNFCGLTGMQERPNTNLRFMTMETAQLVASRIAESGWNPRIELALRGEPTLNPLVVDIVANLRELNPRLQLQMTTNGGGLLRKPGVEDNVRALFDAGLNILAIDDYAVGISAKVRERLGTVAPRGLETVPNVDALWREYPADDDAHPNHRYPVTQRRVVFIEDIEASAASREVIVNHAGFGSPLERYMKPCTLPFREVSINWDGTIDLCCVDWLSEYRCGDLRQVSLTEIWRGARFEAARRYLIAGRRGGLRPCMGCNHRTHNRNFLPGKGGDGREGYPEPNQGDIAVIREALEEGPRERPSSKAIANVYPALPGWLQDTWRERHPTVVAPPPAPALETPAPRSTAVVTRAERTVSRNAGTGPFNRVAVVEWFPRVAGAVDWAGHLSAAHPGLELVTCSKSGRPLAAWTTPWDWRTLPTAQAARLLNEYDAVVVTDVACFAPETREQEGLPWYSEVLRGVTKPMTAVFHGGMRVKSAYDETIDTLFNSPGFTGSVVTVREQQARDRLSQWPLRYVGNSFLPYNVDRVRGIDLDRPRTRELMSTSRLMTNKGQQALVLMLSRLNHDVQVWGYGSYGRPSVGWILYEAGLLLGYRAPRDPMKRRDKLHMTNPNNNKFYTGRFEYTADNGSTLFYREAYTKLTEVDWSPWLHVSMLAESFVGLLEYTILDAAHAGCIVVVPEGIVPAGTYDGLVTVPYGGSTMNVPSGVIKADFDPDVVAARLNALLALPEEELRDRQRSLYASVRARHDPRGAWESVQRALRGEGT